MGEEENLLLVSSFVGVDQVVGLAAQYGGVAFPAHVDRDSFSVIASLGAIPAGGGLHRRGSHPGLRPGTSFTQLHPELGGLPIFRDSDSHYLETLAGDPWELSLPERLLQAVLDAVRGMN